MTCKRMPESGDLIPKPSRGGYSTAERENIMFWEKVFKEKFEEVKRYAKSRGFTMTSFVRMAVYEYMREERKQK